MSHWYLKFIRKFDLWTIIELLRKSCPVRHRSICPPISRLKEWKRGQNVHRDSIMSKVANTNLWNLNDTYAGLLFSAEDTDGSGAG